MCILILSAIVILIVLVIMGLVFYVYRCFYLFPFYKCVIVSFQINVWTRDNNDGLLY